MRYLGHLQKKELQNKWIEGRGSFTKNILIASLLKQLTYRKHWLWHSSVAAVQHTWKPVLLECVRMLHMLPSGQCTSLQQKGVICDLISIALIHVCETSHNKNDGLRYIVNFYGLGLIQREFPKTGSLRKQLTFCNVTTSFLVTWPQGTPDFKSRGWLNGGIPYWWHVTTLIWVVLLIGLATKEICFNQSEVLPRSWWWHTTRIEFQQTFLRHHFAGKLVVVSLSCCSVFCQFNLF